MHFSTNEEVWKDIKGHENNYQISNKGRVRSKDRYEYMIINDGYRLRKGQLIKGEIDKQGYHRVGLWKNARCRKQFVHRLVAEAFIPNPKKHPIINHIDENPLNNNVENLEWCSHSYNSTYKGAMERQIKSKRKPLIGTHVENGNIIEFNSVSEAIKAGFNHAGAVARGERNMSGGYRWEFKK